MKRMKSHLTKLSLALLSAAFLLGCQGQGSEPVGPEGPQFDKKGTGTCVAAASGGHCHGDGDDGGGGGGTVPVDITVTGGLATLNTQVVGFKDRRKEIELFVDQNDPKINLAINMNATYNNAMHEPTEEDPLAFDPAICVQSGRGAPTVAQLNALFNTLQVAVRPINFFFVAIDKTVLGGDGSSEKHLIAANGEVDGTTRVFNVKPTIVEKSGDITNGGLTFTFTEGHVMLRSFIEAPHATRGFNLLCPNEDIITMTLESR